MKLQLTAEERKAVKDSINHWKKDIRDRLLKRDLIINNFIHLSSCHSWSSDNSIVKMYEENCALCLLLKNKNASGFKFCMNCAYYKKYGVCCTNTNTGDWVRFSQNPTLENCNKMIEALEKILK